MLVTSAPSVASSSTISDSLCAMVYRAGNLLDSSFELLFFFNQNLAQNCRIKPLTGHFFHYLSEIRGKDSDPRASLSLISRLFLYSEKAAILKTFCHLFDLVCIVALLTMILDYERGRTNDHTSAWSISYTHTSTRPLAYIPIYRLIILRLTSDAEIEEKFPYEYV